MILITLSLLNWVKLDSKSGGLSCRRLCGSDDVGCCRGSQAIQVELLGLISVLDAHIRLAVLDEGLI